MVENVTQAKTMIQTSLLSIFFLSNDRYTPQYSVNWCKNYMGSKNLSRWHQGQEKKKLELHNFKLLLHSVMERSKFSEMACRSCYRIAYHPCKFLHIYLAFYTHSPHRMWSITKWPQLVMAHALHTWTCITGMLMGMLDHKPIGFPPQSMSAW